MGKIEYAVVVIKNGVVQSEMVPVTGFLAYSRDIRPVFAVRKDSEENAWKVDHVPSGRWGFVAPKRKLAIQVAQEMGKVATDDILSPDWRQAGRAFPRWFFAYLADVFLEGFVPHEEWGREECSAQ